MGTFLLLLIGITFNVLLAILVSLNHRDRAARALIAVAGSLIFWETANYFADHATSGNLMWNKLTFIGPIWTMLFGCLFISFIRKYSLSKVSWLILIGMTIFVSTLSLTNVVVSGVTPRSLNGEIVGFNPVYGRGYLIYVGWILFLVILHLWLAFHP